MGIKEYLDECLNKYYIGILTENGFELSDSNTSGMAGMYSFKSNWLKFDIVNDRGIIETRISSLFSEQFFDLEVVNAYLNRIKIADSCKPKFGKNDLSKRLDLNQESQLFAKHTSELKEMFNMSNYKQTELELEKIGNERADILFG